MFVSKVQGGKRYIKTCTRGVEADRIIFQYRDIFSH